MIAGDVAMVGVFLAVIGVAGSSVSILALFIAAICGLLFRRTVTN